MAQEVARPDESNPSLTTSLTAERIGTPPTNRRARAEWPRVAGNWWGRECVWSPTTMARPAYALPAFDKRLQWSPVPERARLLGVCQRDPLTPASCPQMDLAVPLYAMYCRGRGMRGTNRRCVSLAPHHVCA